MLRAFDSHKFGGCHRFGLLLAALLGAAAPAAAQSVTATLTSTINPLAKLSLSTTTVTFPDAEPDLVAQIAATGGPITVTAKARVQAGSVVTLTVQASDDLRSGLDVIPAANLTWTATGAGFVAGTLSKSTAVTLATWSTSGVRTGTQTWRFRNQWTYATGMYSVAVLYTLSAP